MCTVVLVHGGDGAHRVWVAANRDEDVARPAEGWALRGGLLAPRDAQAGGTWIGVSPTGVFAAVTNRFGRPPDASRRSRGEVVPTLLQAATAHDAAGRLQSWPAAQYNPFHAIVADAHEAWLGVADGAQIAVRQVTGVVVVTERSAGAAPTEREAWLVPAARALAAASSLTPASPEASVSAWWDLLGQHRDPTFEGTCVHLAERRYGTRSAALVGLGASPLLRVADGPPCVTPPQTLDALLAAHLGGPPA